MIARGPGGILEAVGHRMRALPLARWSGIRAGFILSTGRTGTLRLAEVLDAVTDATLVLHEPGPDLFDLGDAVARGEVRGAEAARQLRRTRQRVCNLVRWKRVSAYVESNNNAAALPGVIRAVFDEPRFVHIVRDGPATVRSLFSNTTLSRRPGRGEALFMDHDDHRCRLAALDFPGDPWREAWPELPRFERVCWYWAKKNALIREALDGGPDALVVRFEDVFDASAGYPGFRTLVEFLGLEDRLNTDEAEIHDLLSRRSNRARRYLLPEPDAWPPELRERFDRVAGREQERYYPGGA